MLYGSKETSCFPKKNEFLKKGILEIQLLVLQII